MKAADVIGLGEREEIDDTLLDIGRRVMRLILEELELKAYQTFRQFPSSGNYVKCRAAIRNLDLLGFDDLPGYPVDPWPKCKIRPPLAAGPYTVVRGDSLSKIAKRYYGQENLWDAIYESNGYEGHPDRIVPGQHLTIYAG
jgi:nucleoid-associated protein YgaU